MIQRWKPIDGWEAYEVSDQGRVRSLPRRRTRGRELRAGTNPISGYQVVCLSIGGKRLSANVHTLVARAFLGPMPDGKEVAHADGDPSNNELGNLRYATPVENQADRVPHGRTNRGERSAHHKLTSAQVLAIADRLRAGASHTALGRQYGVARETIRCIAIGRNWAWLTGLAR